MEQYTDEQLTNREKLFGDIIIEHQKQIRKWDIQTHSLFEWLTYTTEELGELAKAIAENQYRDGDAVEIYKEAIQVATLSLKIAEMVYIKDITTIKGNKE